MQEGTRGGMANFMAEADLEYEATQGPLGYITQGLEWNGRHIEGPSLRIVG